MIRFAVALVLVGVVVGCRALGQDVACADDRDCPRSLRFCDDGRCVVHDPNDVGEGEGAAVGEGEGAAGEGEGAVGEGEGAVGEGEGAVGEGEGAAGEGEGAVGEGEGVGDGLIPIVVVSPVAGRNGLIDFQRANGSNCAGTDDDCHHIGTIREAHVDGFVSCSSLVFRDQLGIFDWTCSVDGSGDAVTAHGTLRADKGLADIVDVAALVVRDNVIELVDSGTLVGHSQPARWWSTRVQAAVAQGSTADTVYVAGNTSPTTVLSAARVAVLVKPGETYASSTTVEPIRASTAEAFLWFEGRASGGNFAVNARDVRWLIMRGFRVDANTSGEGFFLGGRNLDLEDLDVHGVSIGMRLSNATNVRIERFRSFNASTAMLIDTVTNLVAHDVVAASSSSSGIDLSFDNHNQVWRNVVLVGQTGGVISGGDGSDAIAFFDITTAASSTAGFDLRTITNVVIDGWLSINDFIGARVTDTTSTPITFANIAAIGDERLFNYSTEPAGIVYTGKLLINAATTGCKNTGDTCNGIGFTSIAAAPSISSIVGNITADTVELDEDGSGRADVAAITRGTLFAQPTRVWAEPSALTLVAARGPCLDTCQIVDTAPFSSSELVNALALSSQNGELTRARELVGAGATDGDGVCEVGETCARATNIGAYQGHNGLSTPTSTVVDGDTYVLASPTTNGF